MNDASRIIPDLRTDAGASTLELPASQCAKLGTQ